MKSKLKTIILLTVIVVIASGAYFGRLLGKNNTEEPAATGTAVETNEPASAGTPKTLKTAQQHVQTLLGRAALKPDPNPVVGVGRGADFNAVTRKAVENAGGLEKVIKPGNSVLIKPNLVMIARPEEAVITDYRVVQSLIDQAIEAGAAKVYVGEGSPWGRVLQNELCGYTKLKNCVLVDFNDCRKEDCYRLRPNNPLVPKQVYNIPKIYMDVDVVISAAKLKTHSDAVVTLTLKNAFGVPPAGMDTVGVVKFYLHANGLANSIVDLNLIRKPEFVVIDGIIGGEGHGPMRPDPVDSQVVFASTDPVACDTVGLTFMGFQVPDVSYVVLAAQHGLGIDDLSKIKVVGADLDQIKMSFKPALGY